MEDFDDLEYVCEDVVDDDDIIVGEANFPLPQVRPRKNNLIFRILYIIYLAAFFVYVYVRLTFTLDAPGLNRIYCICVAALEIATAPALMVHGLTLWRWVSRDPPSKAVKGQSYSIFTTARILIPTFKEPLEVVKGTVHETLHLEVPECLHVHIYVLDDGGRNEFEKWVLSKRTKRNIYLHYVARPKLAGKPNHAKSGNINHVLHYLYDDGLPEDECVIVFDADFMPKRHFLLKVLPVFSENRSKPIALVQTPQHFYNINPDEDMWDHMNTSFFHRVEPSLDRWGAVNCCGTNFVVRSDALAEAGYFPVGCLTEDTLLSLRLCELQWGVAYHHEVLAVGQAPNEIGSIFKQRARWCKGNMQIFLDEFPLTKPNLSLSQRIFYSSLGFNYICIAVSTPFFQLVPVWAIFFGLWPISTINFQFAVTFCVYYGIGNIILLYPPPGFEVKDMWNGELASVNFWATFFKALKGVVVAKLFGGELTFETTQKKTDGEDERNTVGFRMKDLRECFVHISMLLIEMAAVAYALYKVFSAKDLKVYYTYIIGMSWAFMGMVPYVGVVIYCYYRVRIPGFALSCLRNIQLFLRLVCVGLILFQAVMVKNKSTTFTCPHDYGAQLGIQPLTIERQVDELTGQQVERNAFWLLGVEDDMYTLEQIKKRACLDNSVPVIVLAMLPKHGIELSAEISHYLPNNHINTWNEYDARLILYAEELKMIPSLIVMEPSLLMHTFDYERKYWNWNYQFQFFERIYLAKRIFHNSWVYVDAGNPLFLQWQVNMDYMVDILKQLQSTIRGFTVNVGSYVNTTYSGLVAHELFCKTGLHYLIDTSRNGGLFSERPLESINQCKYDPPQVSQGHLPSWKEGSKSRKLSIYSRLAALIVWQKRGESLRYRRADDEGGFGEYDEEIYLEAKEGSKGAKTYSVEGKEEQGTEEGDTTTPVFDDGLIKLYDVNETCVSSTEETSGLDAYVWIKTPGESDGRLFDAGTLHSCLLNHYVECSTSCPQYVPRILNKYRRKKRCQCSDISEDDYDY